MPDQANFAIRDGDYDIVYIAANGALFKYFPAAQTLRLMKSVAVGEQGQMVGYGALTQRVPISGVLELVFMPSASGDKVWHFTPGAGWVDKPAPAPSIAWTDLIINPLNANQWCAWQNGAYDYATRRVWMTNDAGLTWTRVPMPTATTIDIIGGEWSRHASGFLWLVGNNDAVGSETVRASVWHGSPFTAPLTHEPIMPVGRTSQIRSAVVGDDGAITTRGVRGGNTGITLRQMHTVTAAGVKTLISEPAAVETIFWLPLIGTANIVGIRLGSKGLGANRRLWHAPTPTGTLVETALEIGSEDQTGNLLQHGWIDVTAGMRYWAGRHPNGIQEITNPFGSPSMLPSYAVGQRVGSVRADAQTRATLASVTVPSAGAAVGTLQIHVFKDAVWSTMGGPPTASPAHISTVALSPIVRPV